MKITTVDTNSARDVKRFIQFPFRLYKDSPYWVPPLINDMKLNLNKEKHPYFAHSDADFLIAESEGEVLGRIAVLHNRHHNEYQKRKAAFFCYFDVVEDIEVSRALFNAAFAWAKNRDLTEITGPRGLLRFDGTGLLVKGFEHRAAMGMAYNYPYYDPFVTDSGFEKVTDHYSGYILGDFELPPKIYAVAEKVIERKGYTIKVFNHKNELRAWITRIGEIFNASFAAGRDFYPITQDELQLIASNLISIADPRLIKLVMKGEKIIGFILAYPDIGEALQKIKGRLLPFGWLRLMIAQKTTNRLNLNGIGLLPEYQGSGGTTLLYTELYKSGKPMGYEYGETIQVDEENFLSFSEHETMKVKMHKVHRSYKHYLQPV